MAAFVARKIMLAGVIGALLSTLPATGEPRPVRVGVFPAAPLVMVKESGPDGLFIDLIRYFADRLDWSVEYVEGTWGNHLASLAKGDLDLLPAVGYTSARTAIYDFSRDTVYVDSGVLFASRRFPLRTIFDLEGRRVAALRGSVFTTGFTELIASFGVRCEMVLTDDNRAVMEAISRGTADAGVCIYSLGNELAREFPITITPISFSPVALLFAVPKGKNADLVEGIDRLMAPMVDDPASAYSRIFRRWTEPKHPVAIPAWIWWGVAGLAAAGLLLGALTYLLNRQVALKTKHLSVEITDRKQAVEALAAEKERIAVALRSIGDGVITTDTGGNVEIMNKAAEALCGWTQAEAKGKHFSSVFRIIDEGTRVPCADPVAEVLATGRIKEIADRAVLVSRDGAERVIADSVAPIKDAASATIGVVLVFRDMTEKRKLVEAVQRTDKLESLGVLAGGIAHDFNNLLAGIFGYVELARNAGRADPAISKYLDKALSVFDRAKNLAQQLLTFASGGSPVRKNGRIGPLITEMASFAITGSNVECRYAIADDLWQCDYDANQMGQVVDNLVLNARQAMPQGGAIHVAARNVVLREGDVPALKPGSYIEISIADSGVGIPPALQKRIFDPFFTTKETGHGLGLATCISIVRKHSGSMTFESEPGLGTTFHLFLPASTRTADKGQSLAAPTHRGEGTILVMDDEHFLRELVGFMLQSMGYAVVMASNGEEALRLCEQAEREGSDMRAAILDLTIHGGMGGRETARIMHERYPYLPIFASSGYSEDPVMSSPADFGFAGSIRKPFMKDELTQLLESCLHRS